MPINRKPTADHVRARIVALTTYDEKDAYTAYCKSIGEKPCTRLREFIQAELADYKPEGKQ